MVKKNILCVTTMIHIIISEKIRVNYSRQALTNAYYNVINIWIDCELRPIDYINVVLA